MSKKVTPKTKGLKKGKKKAVKKKKKPQGISLKRYQKFVVSLASADSTRTAERRLGTSGLGLAGEAGEFADVIKKILYHGMDLNEEVHDRLVKELGDVMWYVTFAADTLQVDLQEIIDRNVEKLSARYPSGKFSHKDFMRKERAK
jgi:NTP pyrophosphatase (non-canonical NTP hydrolase)